MPLQALEDQLALLEGEDSKGTKRPARTPGSAPDGATPSSAVPPPRKLAAAEIVQPRALFEDTYVDLDVDLGNDAQIAPRSPMQSLALNPVEAHLRCKIAAMCIDCTVL